MGGACLTHDVGRNGRSSVGAEPEPGCSSTGCPGIIGHVPHVMRKPGVLGGTALAAFMALVHTVNDAILAILGALLPTLQERFDAGPTLLAVIVAVFWVSSSVTQPVFGALAEDIGLRLVGSLGVLMAATFLSLIGVAASVWLCSSCSSSVASDRPLSIPSGRRSLDPWRRTARSALGCSRQAE
jgi:MFS family permease